jgi:hypothetical protein
VSCGLPPVLIAELADWQSSNGVSE